jgi:hypothetical protein
MPIASTYLIVAGLPLYVEFIRDSNEEGQVFIELLKVTLETSHHDLMDFLNTDTLDAIEAQITYL